MLPPSAANKSLEELDALGPYAECGSPVGDRIRALRHKPLREFSSEDLAFLIRQSVGLSFVVPLALGRLQNHPLTHRYYYSGVLLVAALGIDRAFWRDHPHWRARLDDVAQRTLASLRGQSHKKQQKAKITLEALTQLYDTFSAATLAI